MTPAVELIRLRRQFGRRTAVDSLDLRIDPGTVFGLIGPNGAGKTTTLRMILDIIRPTAGAILVLGGGSPPRRSCTSATHRLHSR